MMSTTMGGITTINNNTKAKIKIIDKLAIDISPKQTLAFKYKCIRTL